MSAAAARRSQPSGCEVSPKPSSASMRAIARPMPARPAGDERAASHGAFSPTRRVLAWPRGDVRLSELVTAGGCAAKYAAGRLEELLAGFVPADSESLLVGLTRPTTLPSTALTTTVRSSSPSTSFPRRRRPRGLRRHRGDERAQRRLCDGRMRRCSRCRSPPSPKSCPPSCSATCFAAQTSACARRGRSSPVGTRSATPSRSTASPSSAPRTQTRSGPRARHGPATRSSSRSRSARDSCSTGTSAGSQATSSSQRRSARCAS